MANGFFNRLSASDLHKVRCRLNEAKASMGLIGHLVEWYIVSPYIVMKITLIDIDTLDLEPHVVKKVLPTQRMVRTVFRLASTSEYTETTLEMLENENEEANMDGVDENLEIANIKIN